jgi:hypothetical protein
MAPDQMSPIIYPKQSHFLAKMLKASSVIFGFPVGPHRSIISPNGTNISKNRDTAIGHIDPYSREKEANVGTCLFLAVMLIKIGRAKDSGDKAGSYGEDMVDSPTVL